MLQWLLQGRKPLVCPGALDFLGDSWSLAAQKTFRLDGGESALVIGFWLWTNFEASKTLYLKAFQSLTFLP